MCPWIAEKHKDYETTQYNTLKNTSKMLQAWSLKFGMKLSLKWFEIYPTSLITPDQNNTNMLNLNGHVTYRFGPWFEKL